MIDLPQPDDCLTDEQIQMLVCAGDHARSNLDLEKIDNHLNACADCRSRIEARLDIDTSAQSPDATSPAPNSFAGVQSTIAQSPTEIGSLAMQLPRSFGRYELLQELGAGGMGQVFKAFDTQLQRHCAIKVMQSAGESTPMLLERFRREATATARLEHPGIVKIYDIGETDGTTYIAMELIQGKDLGHTAADDPMPPKEAASMVREASDAIAHAHSNGIIHRDLKPANLLVTPGRQVKVVDFGLAKDILADDGLTQTGMVMGTISYMAPEQIGAAKDTQQPAVDVYALGGVLYFLLCGRPPLQSADSLRMLELIRTQDPVRPRTLNPDVDRDLETICLKCLQKNPAHRYATAADLHTDLKRYLDGYPIHARRPSRLVSAVRWARRKPTVAALWGLCILIIVGTIVAIPLWAARELRVRQLQHEGQLAEQQTEATRKIAAARERVADAWRTKSVQAEAARQLEKRIFDVRSPSLHVPESLKGLDTSIIESRRRSNQLKVVDQWVDGDQQIVAIRSSPDAMRVATADASGRITLWNAQNGKPIRRLTEIPRRDDVHATRHYLVHQRRFQFEQIPIPDLPFPVDLCWLPDGERLLAPTIDGSVMLYQVDGQDERQLAKINDSLLCAALVGENREAALGGTSGQVWLIKLPNGDDPGKTSESPDDTQSPPHADHTPIKVSKAAIHVVVELSDGRLVCGDSAGSLTVVQMSNAGPKILGRVDLGMSVYDIVTSAGETEGGICDLHVATAGNRIHAISVRQTGKLQIHEQSSITLADDRVSAVHDLALDRRNGLLYALDNEGRLWAFDHESPANMVYRTGPLTKNNTFEMLVDVLARDEVAMLYPYQRRGQVHLFEDRPNRIAVAGVNCAVSVYQTPARHALRDAGHLLQTSLENASSLCFDPGRSELLWALRRDGTLFLVDVAKDDIIDQCDAHTEGASHGICVGGKNSTSVVTAGLDGQVRLWKATEERIVELESPRIQTHERPLLSLAYCPAKGRLGAVDSEATLVLWDFVSGQKTEEISLGDGGQRPHTGKLAFNVDGTQLLAFGTTQSAHGFRLDPIQRLPDQPAMNALGGTGVSWSPTHPQKLLVCDNLYARALEYGERLTQLNEDLSRETELGQCVATTASPDKKRLACLHRNGVVRFMDTEVMITTSTLRAPLNDCVDLSFDPMATSLAVVNTQGRIALLGRRFGQPRSVEAEWPTVDRSGDWMRTRLFETVDKIFEEPRAVGMDSAGRVHAAIVVQEPAVPGKETRDYYYEGALVYAYESEIGRPEVEPLRDGLIHHSSTGLALDADGLPVIAFRQRVPSKVSHYEGDAMLSRRSRGGDWSHERYVRGYNMGYFPVIDLEPRGKLRSVVHFSYEDGSLFRSAADSGAENEWPRQLIGESGEGSIMDHMIRAGDDLLFLSRRRRFFGEDGLFSIMKLDPTGQLTKLAQLELVWNQLFIRTDGAVFCVQRDPNSKAKEPFGLCQLAFDGWRKRLSLSKSLLAHLRPGFCVSDAGEVYLVQIDALSGDWFLFTDRLPSENEGSREFKPTVARLTRDKQVQSTRYSKPRLFLNPQQQPVVVVFGKQGPLRFLEVLRPAAAKS